MKKLSNHLVERFVAATMDKSHDKSEKVYYGTVTQDNWLTMDGGGAAPIAETTMDISPNDRVSYIVKNGKILITGNLTDHAKSNSNTEHDIQEAFQSMMGTVEENYTSITQTDEKVQIEAQRAKEAEGNLSKAIIDIDAENLHLAVKSANENASSAQTRANNAWNAANNLGIAIQNGETGINTNEIVINKDGVFINGNKLVVRATNCAIDSEGNAAFYSAQFPGGIRLGDYTKTPVAYTNPKTGKTEYMCGGATNPITLVASGNSVVVKYSGGSTGVGEYTLAHEDQIPDVKNSTGDDYLAAISQQAATNAINSKMPASLSYSNDDYNYSYFWAIDSISSSGSATRHKAATPTDSDMRLKRNISKISKGFVKNFYKALKPISYSFKMESHHNPHTINFGFLAQDLVRDAGENLGIDEDKLRLVYKDYDISDDLKKLVKDDFTYGVNLDELHAFHVTMIQDLMERVDVLEKEVSELKKGAKEDGVNRTVSFKDKIRGLWTRCKKLHS